jgi:transcription antitermination factor NusG
MVDSHPEPHWYALHVRPNYELAVSSHLRELGLEEYLPIKHCRSLPKRNRFSEGVPLFPGYVFSYVDLDAGPRLYNVPGVIRILGYCGKPTPVEEEEIQTIRTIVNSDLTYQAVPFFSTGEPIVLTDGPLCGVRGNFIATKKGGQLIVSLPLLNRSLAVTVLAEWVARCRPLFIASEDHVLPE